MSIHVEYDGKISQGIFTTAKGMESQTYLINIYLTEAMLGYEVIEINETMLPFRILADEKDLKIDNATRIWLEIKIEY